MLYRHLLPAQGAAAPLSEPQLLRRLRWDGGEGLAQDARGQEGQGRVRADRGQIRQEVQGTKEIQIQLFLFITEREFVRVFFSGPEARHARPGADAEGALPHRARGGEGGAEQGKLTLFSHKNRKIISF